jgi:predicted phage-related endonuclease
VNAPQIVAEVDRSRFLGGSDAAAVMGLSPWTTPLELWMLKTGRKAREAPDAQRQKIYDRGHRLEPFIRDMVIDKLRERGLEVELLECNSRYVDPEHPFLSCEIDFELRLSGALEIGGIEWVFQGEHINCDAKSVTGFARKKWGEEDSEDVPIEYAVQFMHGLMITGRRFCLVAALRSFDDVDIFWTVRDEETITGMRPKLVSFWLDHVCADVPPDTMTFSDIKALFPLDNGLDVEATQEVADKVAQLRTIKAQLKEWEAAEEALTFEIADYISPHTRLMFQGQPLMTWKGQNDTRVDQTRLKAEDPDTYHRFSRTKVVRVLRFSTPKKGT